MKKLVIAEKRSVAKVLADVLGADTTKNGFYEGNGYIVTWCIGHLLALAEPQVYDPKYEKWRYEDLPIIPPVWRYNPSPSTKKQLKVIVELFRRADVETVINACDAGREGELIFRLVYTNCGCTKPLQRLWVSSMEEKALKDGFDSLRPGTDYDNLYYAALCRQRADWLVGMNYSRLYSVIYNSNLRVGRVQTPTLAMVVEREERIVNFVKEPFYVVQISGALPKGNILLERERLTDKPVAEAICAKCNDKPAVIKTVEKQKKTVGAPKLYDLTTLQREANRLFGYTAAETLDYTQKLYESKRVTYPRTDSRFLTEDMYSGIPGIISDIAKLLPFGGYCNVSNINVKQVINNAKVTDHHAIIPTGSAGNRGINSLPDGEKNIFMLIATRLMSAVSEKHIYDETTVTAECEGELFTAKGKMVLQGGWKDIEKALVLSLGKTPKEETEPLPKLAEGQSFNVVSSIREGTTNPPARFTEDSLLAAMETAGAKDMPIDAERRGLGTPATRASIIEGLIKAKFIERKNKSLFPTDKGVSLIRVLPDTVKSPQMTADWEHFLKNIEKGEQSPEAFMSGLQGLIKEMVQTYSPSNVPVELKNQFGGGNTTGGEVIGKCPRCYSEIIEAAKGFFCSTRECKFALFKDNKFFTSKQKKLTKSVAKALLADGRITLGGLYSPKTNKHYSATIILDSSGDGWPQFKMEFNG